VSSFHWGNWNQHGLIQGIGLKQSCQSFLCEVSSFGQIFQRQAWGFRACISPACQSEGEIPILRSESNMNRKSGLLNFSRWIWPDLGRNNISSRWWSYLRTLTLAPLSRPPDSRVSCASEWMNQAQPHSLTDFRHFFDRLLLHSPSPFPPFLTS
jgi:hypothetical protein